MKRKNALSRALVAVTVAASATAVFLLLNDFKNKQIEAYRIHQISNMKDVYNAALTSFENSTKVAFNSEINTSDILSIFAASSIPERKNAAREELYAKLSPLYGSLKAIGIKQLHFHLPNGESFLRMHKPDEYGDLLFSVRPTVKEANTKLKYVKGFEEGRIYNGFRYVYPLFWGGKHIGSVETSVSSNAITDYIKRSTDKRYRFFIDKTAMQKTVFTHNQEVFYRTTLLSDDLMVERVIVQDKELAAINVKLRDEVKGRLKKREEFIVSTQLDGKRYEAVFMPLKDFAGSYVGYFVWYTQDSTLANINKEFYSKLIYAGFGLLALALALGRLERELERRRAAEEELAALNEYLEQNVAQKVEELREKNETLLRQSKHAALGEMLSVVAHQWKQPLSVVSLLAQEIEHDDKKDSEELKHIAKDILYQVAYMSKTLDDFRNFFTPKKHVDSFLASKSIESALSILEKQLKSLGVTVTVDGGDFYAIGKQNDLTQVIINILNNAKDQIRIVRPTDKNVYISIDAKNREIRIADRAGGIKDDDKEFIFEPYFTTKGEEEGNGIGLYMCKLIVTETFGGEIRADNENGGAVFIIKI